MPTLSSSKNQFSDLCSNDISNLIDSSSSYLAFLAFFIEMIASALLDYKLGALGMVASAVFAFYQNSHACIIHPWQEVFHQIIYGNPLIGLRSFDQLVTKPYSGWEFVKIIQKPFFLCKLFKKDPKVISERALLWPSFL